MRKSICPSLKSREELIGSFFLWVAVCFYMGTSVSMILGGESWAPLKRERAATLRLPLEPDGEPYLAPGAFDYMPAFSVVAIASPPGETNRLFVVNQYGLVMVVTNLAKPSTSVFLDISDKVERGGEAGLLGLTFHPGYRTNGFLYVFYTTRISTSQGEGIHDRLSRFEVSKQNADQARDDSELPLITQFDPDENHNAGDLHFGPDGYLYVSLGDGGGGYDQFNNSQRIDKDFFSGILRIDVDKRPGNIRPNPHPAASSNYLIPFDNPFLEWHEEPLEPKGRADGELTVVTYSGVRFFNGLPVQPAKVRTEFYAVGLRNPWRFSFDPVTGDLYCNDTGQDLREEVNLIRSGGNYGWAYMEGTLPGPKFANKPPDAALLRPIAEYDHSQGRRAIVGGLLYRGDRYPELDGAYILSDLEGDIGVVRTEEGVVKPIEWVGFSRGLATFGMHPGTGEVLFSDGVESLIRRLERNPNPLTEHLPKTLSETGIFEDLELLSPKPGVLPYEINVPFWSDNATKRRWFAFMEDASTIGFTRNENWFFPRGMVWVKHFEMEMIKGVAISSKRLETRVLVRGTSGIYGLTYRWGDSRYEAVIVPAGGAEEVLRILDKGIQRSQTWRYPSRKECLSCHTHEGGGALGFKTAQLNRACDDESSSQNQIAAMNDAGYFSARISNLNTLRLLARADQEDWSLEYRARSYLAANCSQCHQPGQASPGFWDARIAASLPQTGLIHGRVKVAFGAGLNQLIVPGHPESSVLLYRMQHAGALRMPPLGSDVIDQNGLDLISRWIVEMGQSPALYEDWVAPFLGGLPDESAAWDNDADNDGESNFVEFLTRQNPLSGHTAWRARAQFENGFIRILFPRIAGRIFRVEWANSLGFANAWQPLDEAGNRPFVSSANGTASVLDSRPALGNRYYRVRILQP